jgi:hypothetical protein
VIFPLFKVPNCQGLNLAKKKVQSSMKNMNQQASLNCHAAQLVKIMPRRVQSSMKNMNQETSLTLRNTIISASIAEEKTTKQKIKLSDTKFRSNSICNMDTVCLC